MLLIKFSLSFRQGTETQIFLSFFIPTFFLTPLIYAFSPILYYFRVCVFLDQKKKKLSESSYPSTVFGQTQQSFSKPQQTQKIEKKVFSPKIQDHHRRRRNFRLNPLLQLFHLPDEMVIENISGGKKKVLGEVTFSSPEGPVKKMTLHLKKWTLT